METKILNIISNSEEPVYELDAYIEELETENEKNIAWEELREIGLKGQVQQRFIALTVITENKPSYLEQLASELIRERHFDDNILILKPIINICSSLMKEEHISFMQDVLDYAIASNNEYLYEVTLRNLITTNSWEKVLKELVEIVATSDELTTVDLLAFFINEQGMQGFKSLVNRFPTKEQEIVKELDKKIKKRLKESYQKMN